MNNTNKKSVHYRERIFVWRQSKGFCPALLRYRLALRLFLLRCPKVFSAWSAENFRPLRHPHLASYPTGSASVTIPVGENAPPEHFLPLHSRSYFESLSSDFIEKIKGNSSRNYLFCIYSSICNNSLYNEISLCDMK